MVNGRSRIVFSLVAFVLVGCSSAPPDSPLEGEVDPAPASRKKKNQKTNDDGEGNPTGTQSTQDGDLDPAAAGDAAAPGTPAPGTGRCSAQQTFDTCMQCCDEGFPGGFEVDAQAFGACVCESPGTCAAACAGSYCAGSPPTAACEQCLQSAAQCNTTAEAACKANASCQGVFACVDSSGCQTKPRGVTP